MNEKLERIKAALRLAIELADKATEGPWKKNFSGDHKCMYLGPVELDYDDVDHALQKANAAFIAHARGFAPAAAKMALGELDELAKGCPHHCSDGNCPWERRTMARIETICRDWPEDVK